MCAFARVVKCQIHDVARLGVLHNEYAVHQITDRELLTIGEITVEQALAGGDDRLGVDRIVRSDLLPVALVEFVPVAGAMKRLTIHLAVHITVDIP